tara:strand:+ start:168728 stop:169738 length:1011 start_codon:yes stop_codon:yes gene_type:complete
MSKNSWGIAPLNWQSLIEEALRRRKAEGLTQREHAALANVSIPTIAAFDRGEITLTLAKAFDILRVVGLVEEPQEGNAQNAFVNDAFARWQSLVNKLPPESPGHFPNGWYRFDYYLEGELKSVSLTEYEDILHKAVTRHSGWPVFHTPTRPDLGPYEIDGTIECWLSPQTEFIERMFNDPAHCDFWRAAPTGRLFLMRGYQEDGQETFPPGSIFDTTLPIWRMGEGLLHAESLASLLRKKNDSDITVHFRATYTGLSGRVLRSWANPMVGLLAEGHGARGDEAMLETIVPATDIKARLAEHLFPLISSLYERFGVAEIESGFVQAEVKRFLNARVS